MSRFHVGVEGRRLGAGVDVGRQSYNTYSLLIYTSLMVNNYRVILVTLGLSALLLPSANAHDRLGKDVSSGSSRSSRSAKSIESSSQESMTHGHPLILGDDGRTLFQAGGLPLTTEQACTDVKLASRTVQTVGGDSELLYKYCQDGFDAGSESNGSPLSEEMVMAGNGTFGTGRIVGGTRSNGSRYPYLALVFDSKSPFCQGFLVAPRWVVTAAHCVDDGTVGLKLGADNYMIDDIVGHKYVTAKVKKQIVHPTYESQYLRPGNKNLAPPADIALLQLASPVTGVKPVKMASKSDKLPKDFRVIGFGRTGEYEADMSKVIREATVKNVSRKKCEDAFNKELKKGGYWSKGAPTYSIGEGIICAGDNKTKKADACQGDSGGPLIKKGKTASEDVVFGVTSFGEGCGRKGLSGGYTNVAYYRDWIDKTIAKNGG